MNFKQILLLVGTAFWWGAAYVWAALGLEGFSPLLLVTLRLVLGSLVLVVALELFGGGVRDAVALFRRRPGAVTLLAVTASAAPFGLITSGQQHVPAGTTGVLIATVPLWTAVLGIWLDRSESLGGRQAIGLLVGLVGVGLVVGAEAVHTTAQIVGAGLILLGALFVALGNFVARHMFSDTPPLTRALVTSTVAAVVLITPATATAEVHLAVKPVVGLIGLAVGSTALLLVLTFRLIDAVGPRRAALSAYLAPGFALILAAIVLGEPITGAAVGGLALIVGGVVLASRKAEPPEPEGVPTLTRSAEPCSPHLRPDSAL
jgi:drug/metabolite transporter (DMT)-like permease